MKQKVKASLITVAAISSMRINLCSNKTLLDPDRMDVEKSQVFSAL